MNFFPQKKLTTFSHLSRSKHRPPTPFCRQNKTNKAVRYGNIFIFCSHYYRSKAIRRARQGGARTWARAVDLPARSFDRASPGVAPPLVWRLSLNWRTARRGRRISRGTRTTFIAVTRLTATWSPSWGTSTVVSSSAKCCFSRGHGWEMSPPDSKEWNHD